MYGISIEEWFAMMLVVVIVAVSFVYFLIPFVLIIVLFLAFLSIPFILGLVVVALWHFCNSLIRFVKNAFFS